MKNEESTALAHPMTTPFPMKLGGREEWGRSEGAPGHYGPPNLILTQSLHHKYTCSKRAVSNLSSLYTLFYSVIYNSVGYWVLGLSNL